MDVHDRFLCEHICSAERLVTSCQLHGLIHWIAEYLTDSSRYKIEYAKTAYFLPKSERKPLFFFSPPVLCEPLEKPPNIGFLALSSARSYAESTEPGSPRSD